MPRNRVTLFRLDDDSDMPEAERAIPLYPMFAGESVRHSRFVRLASPSNTPRGQAAFRLGSARIEMRSRYKEAVRYHLAGAREARLMSAPLP